MLTLSEAPHSVLGSPHVEAFVMSTSQTDFDVGGRLSLVLFCRKMDEVGVPSTGGVTAETVVERLGAAMSSFVYSSNPMYTI